MPVADKSTNILFCSREWAEDVSDSEQINDPEALPAPTTVVNKDGTKTTITYRIDDSGRRVKVTRKTRTTIHREKVNPEVAERRAWAKFGLEKGKPQGPQPDTTSVGENIVFRPSRDWKSVQAAEAKDGGGKAEEKSLKEQLRDKKVKCRICQGEHFTARCPYKDTMAPVGDDNTPAADPLAEDEDASTKNASGGLGAGSGGYVPPHMRKGANASAGERMGGKFERDDLATLRVTNVSLQDNQGGHNDTDIISRSLRWPKNKNFVIFLSASAVSLVSFLQRIEKQVVPRASLLSLSSTVLKRPELARRWMALDIDI